MGILLSAMAGAGDAGVQSINQNIAQQNALDLEKQRSDLAAQKAKDLAVFSNQLGIDSANAQREAQVARIAQAKGGILDNAMDQKYAPSDAAVADAANGLTDAPLTKDQLDAIAQSKARDRAALDADPHTAIRAAIQTGDIDPKTLAQLTDKSDVAAMRAEQFAQRTEMMGQLGQIRAESAAQVAEMKLQAAREKAANGKIDTATGRMLITSEDANIRAATSQIGLLTKQLSELSPKDKEGRAAVQSQLDEARQSIKASKATKDMFMKQLGYPTSDDLPDAKPTPAPSVPNPVAPPMPLPSSKADLKPGVVYNTSRGPAIWNGTAFTATGN